MHKSDFLSRKDEFHDHKEIAVMICYLVMVVELCIAFLFLIALNDVFRSLIIGSSALFFLAPLFLLRKGKVNTGVILISWGVPLVIVILSLIDKSYYIQRDGLQPVSFMDVRIILVASVILPCIITSLKSRKLYLVNLLPTVLAVVLFDPIHMMVNLGYQQTGLHGELYYFTSNGFSLAAVFGLIAGVTMLKKHLETAISIATAKGNYYRLLFDSAHDAILVFEPDTEKVMASNQKANALYGFEGKSLTGQHLSTFTKSDTRSQQLFNKFAKNQFLEQEPSVHISADDREIEVEINASLIEVEGKPYILSINRDVTERNQVINESAKIQMLLKKIAQVSQLGLWEISGPHRVMSCNDITKKIFQTKPGMKPSWDKFVSFFIEGESRDTLTGYVDRAFRYGQAFDDELQILTAENRLVWTHIIGIPDIKDGKVERITGIVQDITQNKLEQGLKDKVEAIAKVGQFHYDLNSHTLNWSRQLYVNAGLQDTRAPITLPGFLNLVHPNDRAFLSDMLQSITDLDEEVINFRFLLPSGEVRYMSASIAVIYDHDDNPAMLYGAVIDTTSLKRVEQSLRKAEMLGRVGSWQVSHRDNKVVWSEQTFRNYGIEPHDGELTLDYLKEFIYQEDYDRMTTTYLEHIRPDKSKVNSTAEYEIRYRTIGGDGKLRHIRTKTETNFDQRGAPVETFGASIDITELVESQQQLAHNEKLLAHVVENIPNMIFLKEAEHLTFQMFNKAGEDLTGISKEELLGKNDFDFFPKEQARAFVKADRQILQSGKVTVIKEEKINTKFKGVRLLRTRKLPISIFDRQFLLGISEDITEVKAEEIANEAHRKQLSFITENATGGTWEWDIHQHQVSWSPKARLLLNTEDLQCHEDEFHHLIHPYDWERHVIVAQAALKGQRVYDLELRIGNGSQKQPKYSWVRSIGDVIFDENKKAIKMAGVLIDIRNRKKFELALEKNIEEIEKKNKELDQFAYVVSHDLKAPLRSINSLAHWLREDLGAITESSKEYFELLISRVNRMDSFINGLLEYSRVGKVKVAKEEIDCSVLIDEILKPYAMLPEVTIIKSDTLPVIYSNGLLIQQLFSNLISNAIKHNNKAEKVVEINYTYKAGNHHFTIADNGPGIPPELRDRVWQIFQTVHNKDEKENTGIGLAIVKKVVGELEGTISMDFLKGECGTYFNISLPDTALIKSTRSHANTAS